jgi:hypothetical protein
VQHPVPVEAQQLPLIRAAPLEAGTQAPVQQSTARFTQTAEALRTTVDLTRRVKGPSAAPMAKKLPAVRTARSATYTRVAWIFTTDPAGRG